MAKSSKWIAIVLAVFGLFSVLCGQKDLSKGKNAESKKPADDLTEESFKTITYSEALGIMKKETPLILDVRTPNEFNEGYIKGAILIPLQQLANRTNEIAAHKDKPILVYCRSGNRSVSASQILTDNGFKKVYNLNGGIKEWVNEGGTLVK